VGVDVRHPRSRISDSTPTLSDGAWLDRGCVRRRAVAHEKGSYDEIAEHPLAAVNDASELDASLAETGMWDAGGLAAQIRELRQAGRLRHCAEEVR